MAVIIKYSFNAGGSSSGGGDGDNSNAGSNSSQKVAVSPPSSTSSGISGTNKATVSPTASGNTQTSSSPSTQYYYVDVDSGNVYVAGADLGNKTPAEAGKKIVSGGGGGYTTSMSYTGFSEEGQVVNKTQAQVALQRAQEGYVANLQTGLLERQVVGGIATKPISDVNTLNNILGEAMQRNMIVQKVREDGSTYFAFNPNAPESVRGAITAAAAKQGFELAEHNGALGYRPLWLAPPQPKTEKKSEEKYSSTAMSIDPLQVQKQKAEIQSIGLQLAELNSRVPGGIITDLNFNNDKNWFNPLGYEGGAISVLGTPLQKPKNVNDKYEEVRNLIYETRIKTMPFYQELKDFNPLGIPVGEKLLEAQTDVMAGGGMALISLKNMLPNKETISGKVDEGYYFKNLEEFGKGSIHMVSGASQEFGTGVLLGSGIGMVYTGELSLLTLVETGSLTKAFYQTAPIITTLETTTKGVGAYYIINTGAQFFTEIGSALWQRRGVKTENIKVDLSPTGVYDAATATMSSMTAAQSLYPQVAKYGGWGLATLSAIGSATFTLTYEGAQGRRENLLEKTIVSGVIGGAIGGTMAHFEKGGTRIAIGLKKVNIYEGNTVYEDIPYGVKFGIEKITPTGIKFEGASIGAPPSNVIAEPKGVAEALDIYGNNPDATKVFAGGANAWLKGKYNEKQVIENTQQILGEKTETAFKVFDEAGFKQLGSTAEKSISVDGKMLSQAPSARSLGKSDIDLFGIGRTEADVAKIAKELGGTYKVEPVPFESGNFPSSIQKYSIELPSGKSIDITNVVPSLFMPRGEGPLAEYYLSSTFYGGKLPLVSEKFQIASKLSAIAAFNGQIVSKLPDKEKYFADVAAMYEIKSGEKLDFSTWGIQSFTTNMLAQNLPSMPATNVIKAEVSAPTKINPSVINELSVPSMSSINQPNKIAMNMVQKMVGKPLFSDVGSLSQVPSLSLPSLSNINKDISSINKLSVGSIFGSSSFSSDIFSGSSGSSGGSSGGSSPSDSNNKSPPPSDGGGSPSPSNSEYNFSFSFSYSNSSISNTFINNNFKFEIPPAFPILPYMPPSRSQEAGGRGAVGRGKPSKKLATIIEAMNQAGALMQRAMNRLNKDAIPENLDVYTRGAKEKTLAEKLEELWDRGIITGQILPTPQGYAFASKVPEKLRGMIQRGEIVATPEGYVDARRLPEKLKDAIQLGYLEPSEKGFVRRRHIPLFMKRDIEDYLKPVGRTKGGRTIYKLNKNLLKKRGFL